MPFSLVLQGYPKGGIPVAHVQGPILHAMFLHLIEQVDPQLAVRLHEDNRYRPFTLSPLAIGSQIADFKGFRLPRHHILSQGTPCSLRITFLDDSLFPTFTHSIMEMPSPELRLGSTLFTITNIMTSARADNRWSQFLSYPHLIQQASQNRRKLSLHFLTPTSFSFGDVDLPLPLPRLIFRSYQRRFQEFCGMLFLPDFVELVERYTAIAHFKHLSTQIIQMKHVKLLGFTGKVTFEIHRKADPQLALQMNLLADFAFFCGTGKKTTMGMGQTVRQ